MAPSLTGSSRGASLRALLAAHVPADALEVEHRDRMLMLLDAAVSDPFSRTHFDPGHVTASAFVLSPDARSLLLILHGKFGLWLQPGGHVDSDDADIVAAARREVMEETGLAALDAVQGLPLLDLDVHPIPANPKRQEPAHAHFDVRIALRAQTWETRAGSDALGTRWVPLDEVAQVGTDESVRRAARTLQRALSSASAL